MDSAARHRCESGIWNLMGKPRFIWIRDIMVRSFWNVCMEQHHIYVVFILTPFFLFNFIFRYTSSGIWKVESGNWKASMYEQRHTWGIFMFDPFFNFRYISSGNWNLESGNSLYTGYWKMESRNLGIWKMRRSADAGSPAVDRPPGALSDRVH